MLARLMTDERMLLGDRIKRYSAPPHVVFQVLTDVDGFWEWLHQAPGEVRPVILEAVTPTRVVWASLWPVSPTDTIEFDLEPYLAGTDLRFRWWSAHPPDSRGIAITRQRLNRYLGSDLRALAG
jgi:hypothetical protein